MPMKKNLIASYIAGIADTEHGEKYSRIIRYFIPEYITSLIIYNLPSFIDSIFIGSLKLTPAYAALGVTNNFLHFIFKIAESFLIVTVVLVGYHNGRHEYKQAGRVLRDTFWITVLSGIITALAVYYGAFLIYAWLGVPAEVVHHSLPYLRIRVASLFCMFLCCAFLGFLRGIKNTRTPMYIYILGVLFFILFDYCLIFGHFGFPALGLNGSALASVIQQAVMLIAAVAFVFGNVHYRQYGLSLFSDFKEPGYIKQLFTMVWPIAIDKAILAAAYLWLSKMINPMGTTMVAAFVAVKDLERLAFVPAIAFAQVITLLVSNDYGAQQWDRIKSNIKKTLFLSTILVGSTLFLISIFARPLLGLFDKKGDFTEMTAHIFPLLGVLVLFDVLQLILAGAMRGSGNVKIVMWVRVLVICCYFVPVSYMLSQAPIANPIVKFLLIYSSFYIGNALMSIVYIRRFRGDEWKHQISPE